MTRRLNRRLDALGDGGDGSLSPTAVMMLAATYGRLHAMFLPYRSHLQTWPEINRLRRGYIAGTIGLSAAVTGQRNWVAGHDARRELEAAGLAVAVKGATETTGLILTPKGRATAWGLCRELVPTVALSWAMTEQLSAKEPCRIRGEERWVSESKLFELPCTGTTDQWQEFTDMLLEPAVSGCVDSTADVQGRVFYRYLKPFEELPEVDDPGTSAAAEDSYLSGWKSELARLRSLESVDGEICIPLSVT